MPKNNNSYQKEYQNEWYKKKSDEYKARQKENRRLRVQRNKQYVIELRSNPCSCCKEIQPQEIMEFHHIDGSPEARVCHLYGSSIKRLQEEVDKCILVCPNCHAKIHAGLLSLK
jgi:hypothetical protein